MTLFSGFVVFLVLTVALLGGVLVTGFRARRKLHIPLVVLYLASMGITIYFAERMGAGIDVYTAGKIAHVHLTIAKYTTFGYALPVLSGVVTCFRPGFLKVHRAIALLWVVLTVLALVTGIWMGLAAERPE